MLQKDVIALIEKGINATRAQRWADLGCGAGTFTLALQSILPQGSRITAIDKQRQQLPVEFIKADFEKDKLPLSGLDGILMANSFHYIKDKTALIKKLEPSFAVSPHFVIVEYETTRRSPWVPYPIPFAALSDFFAAFDYSTTKLAEQPSAFGGKMYAALAKKS